MYAIVETGGKQYRVELGSELAVERLAADPGSEVVLDRVLLVADDEATAVGRPLVAGAEVRATVVRQDRGEKIIVFKYRPKARHRAKRGHRQELTVLRVADILHDGRSAASVVARKAKVTDVEREEAARAAAEQAARDAAMAAELARKAAVKAESEPTKTATKKAEPKKTATKKAETKKAEKSASGARGRGNVRSAPEEAGKRARPTKKEG